MLSRRRWPKRIAAGVSAALSALVVLVCAAYVAADSDYGRTFLQAPTETIVERLLGDGYVATVGGQRFGIDGAGHLMIAWSDIDIRRVGVARPEARIRSAVLGLQPFALLLGRVQTTSLDVSGADLDLTTAPAAVEVATAAQGLAPTRDPVATAAPIPERLAGTFLPQLTRRLVEATETQFQLLQRRGMAQVKLTDIRFAVPIAPGGGPFVARVETASMDLSDPSDMRMAGRFGLDTVSVPFRAGLDVDAGRIVSDALRGRTVAARPAPASERSPTISRPCGPLRRLRKRRCRFSSRRGPTMRDGSSGSKPASAPATSRSVAATAGSRRPTWRSITAKATTGSPSDRIG